MEESEAGVRNGGKERKGGRGGVVLKKETGMRETAPFHKLSCSGKEEGYRS